MRPFIVAVTALGAALLASGPAVAQPGASPSPDAASPAVRQGVVFGADLGVGVLNDHSEYRSDGHPITVDAEIDVGYMLTPQLALKLELGGQRQTSPAGNDTLTQLMAVAALQNWITPTIWLKGGLGFSSLRTHFDFEGRSYDETLGNGAAFMGAAGYEVLHRANFAVDLRLHVTVSAYEGTHSGFEYVSFGSFGAGVNWY